MGQSALMVACMTLTLAAGAESQVARLSVIDQMLEALGGADRIAAIDSLTAEADCLSPDGPFTTLVESRTPANVRFLQTFEDGATEIRSTPSRTWTVAADGSVRDLDPGFRSMARGHEFHLLVLQVYERFADHRLAMDDGAGANGCRVVRMVDEDQRPASLCLHRSSHLPL